MSDTFARIPARTTGIGGVPVARTPAGCARFGKVRGFDGPRLEASPLRWAP